MNVDERGSFTELVHTLNCGQVSINISKPGITIGEGAKFVASRQVGYTSEPGDYEALRANIERLRDMPAEEFQTMSGRCIEVSRNELDFEKQMKEAYEWLELRS